MVAGPDQRPADWRPRTYLAALGDVALTAAWQTFAESPEAPAGAWEVFHRAPPGAALHAVR